MEDRAIQRERAQNIWGSFARKLDAVAQATHVEPIPDFDLSCIGGLDGPKDEIQTYACAATNPEVYERWGTYPPSGLLLIGRPGVGKTLLARALANLTHTSFLQVDVPRLVIEVIHRGGKMGELLSGWSQVLAEMPPLTVFFAELEFSQAREIGARRADLPVGPVMDMLLDLVDRTIACESCLVVGSNADPPYMQKIEKHVAEAGLGTRVIFTGYEKFPAACMAAMDVVVHTSTAPEPFGLVVLEGMALGRPVVATRHGGPMDVIEEGESGFLTPPDDEHALAAVLDRLLGDPALRQRVGEAGRRRLHEKFTARHNIEGIQAVYDRLFA